MRLHYLDPPLLWLYPATYLAHISEEAWAGEGFSRWIAHLSGRTLPLRWFFVAHLVGFALMIAGVRLATRNAAFGWIAIALATVATLNSLSHLAGSVATARYSPGLITGFVLWVPLGQLTLLRAWYQASRRSLAAGLLVGAAIEMLVTLLVFSAGQNGELR